MTKNASVVVIFGTNRSNWFGDYVAVVRNHWFRRPSLEVYRAGWRNRLLRPEGEYPHFDAVMRDVPAEVGEEANDEN